MKVVIIIIIALIIFFGAARLYLQQRIKKEVYHLFSLCHHIHTRQFSYSQLNSLPAPVQRYFKYAMMDGQPYIYTIRLQHNGLFRTSRNSDWMNIEGTQYFTAGIPGFLWKGKTRMFTAIDKFINDQGNLTVKLASLFNVVKSESSQTSQAELQRWLAESVWFPSNLLPGEHLTWEPIDGSTARLLFTYKDLSISYIVSFNDKGEIIQFTTTRYLNKDRLETWIGKCSVYKKINNVRIPTALEAIWDLKDGSYSYARFYVQRIEYNMPAPF